MSLFRVVFNRFEEVLMMAGMAVMVTLNFTNVLFRHLLPQTPFSYTEELNVLIFIWVTMLGIACGYKRISHTSLSIVTDLLPVKFKKMAIIFSMLCSMAFFIMVCYQGIFMVENQIAFHQILPGMKIPKATAGLAIPVCSLIILIRIVEAAIQELQTVKNSEEK